MELGLAGLFDDGDGVDEAGLGKGNVYASYVWDSDGVCESGRVA